MKNIMFNKYVMITNQQNPNGLSSKRPPGIQLLAVKRTTSRKSKLPLIAKSLKSSVLKSNLLKSSLLKTNLLKSNLSKSNSLKSKCSKTIGYANLAFVAIYPSGIQNPPVPLPYFHPFVMNLKTTYLFHYPLLLDIINSSGSTESKLNEVFNWTLKILNVMVIIGAIYAGANIANSMFGLSGDDHTSGRAKGKLVALIVGLIVWFGIQVIIGDIGNVMK